MFHIISMQRHIPVTIFVTTCTLTQGLGTLDPAELYEVHQGVYFLMKDSLIGIDRASYCLDAVHYSISTITDNNKLEEKQLTKLYGIELK